MSRQDQIMDGIGEAGFAGLQQPSEPRVDGHTTGGKFAPGNKCGRGNPMAGRVAKLRAALLAEVTETDLRAIVRNLIKRASYTDVAAAKLVLAYCVGQPLRWTDDDQDDDQEK